VQVINVACGGTLVQDLHSEQPDLAKHDYFPPSFERYRISHSIAIESDSHLAAAMGQVHEVNSMHHQGIDAVGYGLRVVARAEDGLPEALEVPALPFVVGVQWHPEELSKTDQMSANLFYNFVRAAADDWRSQVPSEWGTQFEAACMALHVNGSAAGISTGNSLGNGGTKVNGSSAAGLDTAAYALPQAADAAVSRGNCG
jgi:putative glutamine amidotransferase